MANLTGVFADLGNLIPSQGAILDSVLAGVAGTVILSGAKSKEGQDALDPFHLFHNKDSGATGVVTGSNVMTMSKFLALTPDQQKMLQTMGYTVIPG